MRFRAVPRQRFPLISNYLNQTIQYSTIVQFLRFTSIVRVAQTFFVNELSGLIPDLSIKLDWSSKRIRSRGHHKLKHIIARVLTYFFQKSETSAKATNSSEIVNQYSCSGGLVILLPFLGYIEYNMRNIMPEIRARV